MRPTLAGIFVLALAGTVLAGDGVVLVPHSHAWGTAADHPHALALYRFPIALLGSPADAAMPAADRGSGPSFRLARPLAETLAGASLVVVAALVIVVAAPTLARALHAVSTVPRRQAQWWSSTPTGPPRLVLLSV